MTTTHMSVEEQNFIRFVKACLDVIKLPLIDILRYEIQPIDLFNKIQSSHLLSDKKNKLGREQQKICFCLPPAIPNYQTFDFTLLYKLIRNLCFSLEPTHGWGKEPDVTDIQIGDDIERLRLFRNKYVHDRSTDIPNKVFEHLWKDLRSVIQRTETFVISKGFNPCYEQKLSEIKTMDLGNEKLEQYKIAFLVEYTYDCLKQKGDRDEPDIYIEGPEKVICGEIANIKATVLSGDAQGWSISWQKLRRDASIRISTDDTKFMNSNERQLVIHSVNKEDEGGYQAVLSREASGKNLKIISNTFFLYALGDQPLFVVWKVTTGIEGITIHYEFKEESPFVYSITWTKNGKPLCQKDKKYVGGGSKNRFFTIASPTKDDTGNYSCTATNSVGKSSQEVTFDVPRATISTEQEVFFGSHTLLMSEISSCPSLEGAEWQTSMDGNTFCCVDISQPKYYGSSRNPELPSMVIPKVTFDDKLYYRLLVWNKIGEQFSNTVYLDVIGNPPNITTSHRTCMENRAIELIANVFLYEKLPVLHNVFWTKNGEKLDTQGSGGRYNGMTTTEPSLTIFDVSEHDAGSYQLTATNLVGATTSDVIVLGVPEIILESTEKKEDGSCWFTLTIKSIPAPTFVQWSIKEKSSIKFNQLDTNAVKFKGTSSSLPHPVLVIKHEDMQEKYCFQIEVGNFIGSRKKIIPDGLIPDNRRVTSKKFGKNSCLNKFYNAGGAGVRFAILLDDLAENFPEDKLNRLKFLIEYSCHLDDIKPFYKTSSARDCFRILFENKLVTPMDVIFMQYLLKQTNCTNLFDKCVEYAENQETLCFFVKPPENGFKTVQFHVKGDLSDYDKDGIKNLKDTVAAILGCKPGEIHMNGLYPSSSFFIVLAMNDIPHEKLKLLEQEDKDRLSEMNIDFFTVDSINIAVGRPKESVGLVKKITNLFKDEALCLTDGEDIISNLHNVCFKAETSRSSKAIMDTEAVGLLQTVRTLFKDEVLHLTEGENIFSNIQRLNSQSFETVASKRPQVFEEKKAETEDLLLHLEEDISKEEEEITEEPYNYKSTIKVATNC